jgi:hypothetical protein
MTFGSFYVFCLIYSSRANSPVKIVFPSVCTDRNQTATRTESTFAENVRGPWLRRDLKKRIRDHPDLTFTDIREEATLLIQDEDSDQQHVDQYKDVAVGCPCLNVSFGSCNSA